jgi:hypothetical protein
VAALVVMGLLFMAVGAAPASAGEVGDPCGCTPGYLKNHPEAWVAPYTTDIPVEKLFAQLVPGTDLDGDGSEDTLLDALDYGGGPGVAGAQRILIRAAVAATLNKAKFGPAFFYPGPVRADTDAALASGDRDTMLTLADAFDFWNNTLCPLDGDGNHE